MRTTLLILDSWPAQKNSALYSTPEKPVALFIIPPKATKYVQPLDVYFFRQFKLFAKRISDYVRSNNQGTRLNDRLFIICMLSFIYNQLSAPIFVPMLKYAWTKSGYFPNVASQKFKNVLEVNFANFYSDCSSAECQNSAFCKCAYCEKNLCLYHCINLLHLH